MNCLTEGIEIGTMGAVNFNTVDILLTFFPPIL